MVENLFFIIGTHRSGSTFLKNILNKHSEVIMFSDEPDISDPWHYTFLNHLKRCGNLNKEKNLEKFMTLLKSGKIHSTFWKELAESEFDFECLKNEIKFSDKSPGTIFSLIIEGYRKLFNKPVIGAKYPLHISRLDLLTGWYPNARFIFLIRNIFASAVSRINDEATSRRVKNTRIFGFIVHYITLFHFLIDFNWAAKIYNQVAGNKNVLLVKYEDLIINNKQTLATICSHIFIDYEDSMSKAYGKPSSYNGQIHVDIDKTRINNWKKYIKKRDYFIIKIFTKQSRKVFGYGTYEQN